MHVALYSACESAPLAAAWRPAPGAAQSGQNVHTRCLLPPTFPHARADGLMGYGVLHIVCVSYGLRHDIEAAEDAAALYGAALEAVSTRRRLDAAVWTL